MIDEMIDLIRAGTYAVKPMAQTAKPERTWKVPQDGQVSAGGKSPGTLTASRPNNAGGLGDSSGAIMLDRFVGKPISFVGRSNERTVRDASAIADVMEDDEHTHGGPGGFADGGRAAVGGAPVRPKGSPIDGGRLG
jgi:hypothetical protein